jgi:hypothetical protein
MGAMGLEQYWSPNGRELPSIEHLGQLDLRREALLTVYLLRENLGEHLRLSLGMI